MDSIAYQKILFRTAMCVMACDGDIHHSEVREMEVAFEKTDFFKDLVFKTEIDFVLDRFKSSEKEFLIECVDNLSKATMSPVQELQILELALRIIYADNRVDKNEIDFVIFQECLHSIRSEFDNVSSTIRISNKVRLNTQFTITISGITP